jgi:hypothetical protein
MKERLSLALSATALAVAVLGATPTGTRQGTRSPRGRVRELQGPPGFQGIQGIQRLKGATGPKGPTGFNGVNVVYQGFSAIHGSSTSQTVTCPVQTHRAVGGGASIGDASGNPGSNHYGTSCSPAPTLRVRVTPAGRLW